MNDLHPGDRINIMFVDALDQSAKATVRRFLSDRQEGLSPEADNYVSCWMEVTLDDQDTLPHTQTVAFGTDWKYYMDGREVKISKYSEAAS